MIKNIIMPQGSQDLVPARVVRWAVAEGSPVKKGELVCEVETEKAVFEINSPMDGYLRKIITKEGEEADVFATIAYVGELSDPLPGEAAEAAPAVVSAAAPVPEAPAPVAPGGAPSGRVRITPKAKHMAKDLQVDYAGLLGQRTTGTHRCCRYPGSPGGCCSGESRCSGAGRGSCTCSRSCTCSACCSHTRRSFRAPMQCAWTPACQEKL